MARVYKSVRPADNKATNGPTENENKSVLEVKTERTKKKSNSSDK